MRMRFSACRHAGLIAIIMQWGRFRDCVVMQAFKCKDTARFAQGARHHVPAIDGRASRLGDSLMTRRRFLSVAAFASFAACLHAQTKQRMPRIGVIRWDQASLEPTRRNLSEALHARGYVENKNIVILAR